MARLIFLGQSVTGGPPAPHDVFEASHVETETYGAPVVQAVIAGAGHAETEAYGSPSINPSVVGTGYAETEAYGGPGVQVVVVGAGFADAEASGSSTITAVVAGAGVAEAEAYGQPVVEAVVVELGYADPEAYGHPTIDTAHYVYEQGFSDAEAYGHPTVTWGTAPVPVTPPQQALAGFGLVVLPRPPREEIPPATVRGRGHAEQESYGRASIQLVVVGRGRPSRLVTGRPTVSLGQHPRQIRDEKDLMEILTTRGVA